MERGRQRNKIITVKSLAALVSLQAHTIFLAGVLDSGAGIDEILSILL